ncbi:hypothetical protein FD15_GL001341 [Liquorilactobacillus sucicola DSM 21376 = JCM 15457]|uniref:Uncharacterized protein n=1 Tax=Liquorilactobacillus sucicola DSM 21376 = JCM 15457 TaxID=1423806 RepID=A0A0R2DPW9_9LACO|nr:hypothetical protein FD15_GL001341 [Liquorilactobacillus sucicola DSM 21376 = JCM 15457]
MTNINGARSEFLIQLLFYSAYYWNLNYIEFGKRLSLPPSYLTKASRLLARRYVDHFLSVISTKLNRKCIQYFHLLKIKEAQLRHHCNIKLLPFASFTLLDSSSAVNLANTEIQIINNFQYQNDPNVRIFFILNTALLNQSSCSLSKQTELYQKLTFGTAPLLFHINVFHKAKFSVYLRISTQIF